jgi:hypothetical protein
MFRGFGHRPVPQSFVQYHQPGVFHGWNPGSGQIVKLGAGGPSGFIEGTAGAPKPWPYVSGIKNFLFSFPYGIATTKAARPFGPNIGSGNIKFLPVGTQKAPSGPVLSF